MYARDPYTPSPEVAISYFGAGRIWNRGETLLVRAYSSVTSRTKR